MRAPHEVMAGGKPEGRHRGMPRPGRVSRDVTGLKLNFGARVYGCRSWTKFVPTDPRRDPRLREDCDIVSPIFTHLTSALRLTMVTPVTRQRISAAYLYAGLAVGTLDRYLSFHVGQGTRQKKSPEGIYEVYYLSKLFLPTAGRKLL